MLWQRGERLHREQEVVSLETIREAMHEHLRELGEPAAYLQLHAAGLAAQAQGHGLMRPEQDFDEALREVGANIQQAIQSDVKLERMDSEERSMEVGLWDLKEGETRAEPLADRVERALVTFLQKHPSSTLLEMERGLYPEFPGPADTFQSVGGRGAGIVRRAKRMAAGVCVRKTGPPTVAPS